MESVQQLKVYTRKLYSYEPMIDGIMDDEKLKNNIIRIQNLETPSNISSAEKCSYEIKYKATPASVAYFLY